MKRRPAQKLLGVALEADRARLAEVTPGAAGRRQLVASGEFIFPAGVGLERPAELGSALGDFLRQRGFNTRDAVIGLSARVLLTRRCDLPPATTDLALASLRLQAESIYSTETRELVVDFAGDIQNGAASRVLLMAAGRAMVAQCRQFAAAAHLQLRVLTATTPALAGITAAASGNLLVVNLTPTGAELCIQNAGSPVQLNYQSALAQSGEMVATLAAEIRRMLAGQPAGGEPWAVAVWDGASARTTIGDPLHERLELPVTTPRLDSVITTTEAEAQRFSPAAALAYGTGKMPVDFLHSRLAPPPLRTRRRKIVRAAALAVALLLAIAAVVYNLKQRQANLADMQSQLATIQPAVKQAHTEAARLNFVRLWHSGSPRMVACLRDLTKVFPDDGSIYATSLTLRSEQSGQLTGKAANEHQVLDLRDRMNANRAFFDIGVVDMRQAGRASGQYEFTIAFKYRGLE